MSRRQISDVLQPVRLVLRCSAVKSLVDNDRQFELDALGCSEPVSRTLATGAPYPASSLRLKLGLVSADTR